jgi:hypothetical protein
MWHTKTADQKCIALENDYKFLTYIWSPSETPHRVSSDELYVTTLNHSERNPSYTTILPGNTLWSLVVIICRICFNNLQPCIPSLWVLMVLTVNSDYFLKQHQPVDLCNGEVCCSLWGTDWNLKYYLDELRLQSVIETVKDFQNTVPLC